MTPERTASQVGQLITSISKSGGELPGNWTPQDLIGLISSYSKLIKICRDSSRADDIPAEPDDVFQTGRLGAYEDMVEKLKALEGKGKSRKNKS